MDSNVKRLEKQRQLIIDYKFFETKAGQNVLADLKRRSNFNYSVVPKGSDGHIDPLAMARNEGQRSIVVHIERMLEADLMKGTKHG